VEIVSEAAHFFRVLFTPSALYMDEEPSRRIKFTQLTNKGEKSANDKNWLRTCWKRTWASFDSQEVEPDWSMASNSLLDELDELNGRMLIGLKMFSYWVDDEGEEDFKQRRPYWDAVRDLMKKYVVNEADQENLVTKNILFKLRWYLSMNRHKQRLQIPILTPKMLDALAANFLARAKAYEEVSDIAYLIPLTSFIAGLTHAFKQNLKAGFTSFTVSNLTPLKKI